MTIWPNISEIPYGCRSDAHALHRGGQRQAAIDLIRQVNQVRPSVSSRLIEGRFAQKEYRQAIEP